MADSTSKLTLYGTAMYGSMPVIVGDIQRPLISEGALTGPPNNLTIVKSGETAWTLDEQMNLTGFYVTVRRRAIIYIISKTRLCSVHGNSQYLSATVL
jgi:hypothetical protein